MAKSLFRSLPTENSGFFQRVYGVVKLVPCGKVMTYGQIAKILGTKDARKVSWALHANRDKDVPCHRVVNKNGRLAPSYAFGGSNEQKMKLDVEGAKFVDEMHVDLKKSSCVD